MTTNPAKPIDFATDEEGDSEVIKPLLQHPRPCRPIKAIIYDEDSAGDGMVCYDSCPYCLNRVPKSPCKFYFSLSLATMPSILFLSQNMFHPYPQSAACNALFMCCSQQVITNQEKSQQIRTNPRHQERLTKLR